MESEHEKIIKALQVALQMEIDGKEYYLRASRESTNELGRKLLESLAAEEDIHRQKFEKIYNAVRSKKGWPQIDFRPDGGKGLRTIFARAIEVMGAHVEAAATELGALKTAMDMENKTYDYYKKQEETATWDVEKGFYEALAGEEREHYLILLDYHEYLRDPASWFVQKERPSLDGG
jgi:rubrerythrin